MRRITKYIVWAGVGGALYFVANNHFVYFGGHKYRLLKKKELTFSHTFFSTELKTPEAMLKDDVFREAGLGDLLVEEGLLSEERKVFFLKEIEEENE